MGRRNAHRFRKTGVAAKETYQLLLYFISCFNNCAFRATITVLTLISTAPRAGLSTKFGFSSPVVSGIATTFVEPEPAETRQ